jgi:enediyne biosynthesis protein E3
MSAAADDAGTSAGMNLLTRSVRGLLKLSPVDALFETRGFEKSNAPSRSALEQIGMVFIGGFNASLAAGDLGAVLQHVNGIPAAERGFAVEGAAMGAAVADAVPFSQSMFPGCIAAFKSDFTYLAHVGAGWALARVPWRHKRILSALDPVHRWLAIDGLGFHDTYFYHGSVVAGWRRKQSGYATHAYDQGVGRALWFVSGGSIAGAIRLLSSLAVERQGDLWSGLGLAMTYAGPVAGDDVIDALKAAGGNAASFAQGVAFACEARALGRYVPDHTCLVVQEVWNRPLSEVVALVRQSRHCLSTAETDPPRYQLWRETVARAFTHSARKIP